MRRQRRGTRLRAAACALLAVAAASMVAATSARTDAAHRHRRWTPAAFPNPQLDVSACGRGVRSSLCDPEGILDREAQDMVDGLINEIASGKEPFKRTPCGTAGPQGAQVAVALMHRMDHKGHADSAAAAHHFARALHTAWGVGHPACQNGLLLLLAVGDRQVYVSTGAGVKAVVSDSQLSAVLDSIRPALKHKRYGEAVLAAVQQLGLLASGKQPEPPGVDGDDGLGIFLFFSASIAGVMLWAWRNNRKQAARFRDCASKLAQVKRDQAAIRSRQYAAASCPICLEDFDAPLTAAGAAAAARAAGSSAGAGSSSAAAAAAEPADESSPSAPLLPPEWPAAAGEASAGDAGGSSSSAARKATGRTPLVLRCGHAFCDPCISQWLKAHTNCPICRKDLEASDEPTPSNPEHLRRRNGSNSSGDASAAAPPPASCGAAAREPRPEDLLQRQVWLPELGFRLRRLRMLYPDFVTDPMLAAWEEDVAAGRDLDPSPVLHLDPARQRQLADTGRCGASSSAVFAGGSSRGGGGAGSSW